MRKNRAEREDKVKGFESGPRGPALGSARSLPEERRTLRERTLKRFAAWKKRVDAAKKQAKMRLDA